MESEPSYTRRLWAMRLVLLAFLPCWSDVGAQFDATSRVTSVYPDISIEAATHLRTAASYVADQNWAEAIELYQKLIEKFGDKVVQLGTRPLYVTVRDYCHMQLASMPPQAIELYRKKIDAVAETWFKAGWRQRDREPLMRVVEQAFVSSWGDDALNGLAEIAFEAGDFDQAALQWGLIHRPASEDVDRNGSTLPRLLYPDTDLDRSLIEAKQVLCQIFLGNKEAADRAVGTFREQHAVARGMLGGSEGMLADRLASIARDVGQTANLEDNNWLTFAGNPQRTKVMPEAIDIGSVQWKADLPQVIPTRIGVSSRPLSNNSDDLLSYHPLVFRDQVIVSGRDEVRTYDLHEGPKNEGEPLWTFRLRDQAGQPSVIATRPSAGSPQYTMTAHRGRLYVRMGTPETTLPIRRGGQPDSYLVCLDLMAEGKELWRIQPEQNEPDLAFEGSPVVADGNVYVGVTRGGAMTHSFLACYDATTGAKKWRTLICESSSTTSFFNAGSISHNLPTLGGGMVFYNTNLGAIAALDQRTGRIRWIATYTRKARDDAALKTMGRFTGRDLSPCIYYGGTVFALPADGEGVHAFDAVTGELRWRTPEPPHLAYMIGVAHGRLICSGTQLVAIDVNTGQGDWQWSDSAATAPYGRGVLAGDYVYFPTKTHVYIVDQRTGVLAKRKEVGALQEKHNYSPGNLVIGDGYLVVAQPTRIVVFCQYEVLINRYRDLIARNPSDPEPHLRLARAAEANDAIELGIDHYRAAIELASADGNEEERAIRQSARTQLHSVLKQLAQKAAGAMEWLRAEEYWREAASVAPTMQSKLDCMLRRAEMWRLADDGAKSVSVYQGILAEDSLRGLGITVDGNRTVRAEVEIAARVQGLLDQFGRSVYAEYESAAVELLNEAEQRMSVPTVERLLRTYPNSEAAVQAQLYLANQYSENGEIAPAIVAYKQVLARPQLPEASRVTALHGLAQLDEARQAWQTARGWWQQLASEFPNTPAPNKPEQSIASFVQERLSGSEYELNSAPASDRLQLPLARRWSRLWGENHRILVPAGAPPAELGMLLLASDPQSLQSISAQTSAPLWTLKLTGPVRWAAFYEDRLLIGTGIELSSVAARTGELIWQQKTTTGTPAFSEFHLVEERLFIREESRRLICVAANSGTTLWTYAPTEAAIQPHAFFSGQHVALLTRQPNKFVVLDGDGRQRFETIQTSDAWEFAPAAVDAHRLCMTSDARSIQLVDLNDGKQVWSYTGPNSDLRPVPIVGGDVLLALVAGNVLVRLDPDSGKPIWSSRVSDDALPRYESAWAIGGDLFYCITRELNLRAFRLTDGTLAWEQFMVGPSDQWQITWCTGYVLALPRGPHSSEGLPMIICRQSDGQPLQRLFFRPHGHEALVHLTTRHALIGSEREVWLLRKDE